MTLVAVANAGGSPGATTAAVALAAMWPGEQHTDDGGGLIDDRVVVEADPAGGVLAVRYGLTTSPGLAKLAGVAGRGLAGRELWRCGQQLPGGLPVVVAPQRASAAGQIVSSTGGLLGRKLGQLEGVSVLVDCGRLQWGSPALQLAEQADVVLVVARPTAEQAPRAGAWVERLVGSRGVAAALLLVGESPYTAGEVAGELGVEVAGVLADDARGAEVLGAQAPRRWGSGVTRLETSAGAVAAAVGERLTAQASREDTQGSVVTRGRS